jgi:hypothetical protein
MLVRALAVLLRVAGTIVRQLMRVLITLFDIVIVVPLLIERVVVNGRAAHDKPVVKPARADFSVGERS